MDARGLYGPLVTLLELCSVGLEALNDALGVCTVEGVLIRPV